MKIFLFSAVIVLMSTVPAFAADEALKSEVDQKLCREMAGYKQPPGVAYEPGVDVHGKPVVEADLNPSPVQVPDTIVFLVSVDMAQYLGLQTSPGTETNATMGAITFENGQLSFNGEPMEGQAAKALRELCGIKPAQEKPKKARKVKHNKD